MYLVQLVSRTVHSKVHLNIHKLMYIQEYNFCQIRPPFLLLFIIFAMIIARTAFH